MKKFIRNCKGAVTVMITLLLIPAILVSGTAVDLARIHTARSVVQDANQLAANSVLASYDAMLQDLYGLFGVMETDPILADMIDEYIRVTVFGEESQDKDLGTFQLFYGSGLQPASVTPAPNKNLRNPQVLRRQIEEYVKFRAPVIIISDLLARIEQFVKIKNDAEAIKDKLDIDDDFSELVKLFQEFYLRLRYNDYYLLETHREELEIKIYDGINVTMGNLRDYFVDMVECRKDYKAAKEELEDLLDNPPDSDASAEEKARYRSDVEDARDDMEDAKREFEALRGNVNSEARTLENDLNGYCNGGYDSKYYEETTGFSLESYKDNIDEIIKLAEKIEKKSEDLKKKIADLRAKLKDCSPELVGTKDSPGIENSLKEYEALLNENLSGMVAPLEGNKDYIDALKEQLDTVSYGPINARNEVDPTSGASLNHLSTYRETVDSTSDNLETLAGLSADSVRYNYFHDAASSTMKRFAGLSNDHSDMYGMLALLYQSADPKNKNSSDKKAIQKSLDKIAGSAQAKFRGFIPEIRGAEVIPGAAASQLRSDENNDYKDPFDNNDWSSAGHDNKAAKKSLDDAAKKFLDVGALVDSAGNKLLLLAYDSEMFSDYTVRYREDAKSLTGVPFGTDVNYLLDSEMEYLFNGSTDAKTNIKAVSGLLFLTRFVFNYISTFKISSVKVCLTGIQAAFAWSGPFAIVVRELARVGFAMAESGLDVAALRSGEEVVLIKTKDTEWKFFGLETLKDIGLGLAQEAVDAAVESLKESLTAQIKSLKSSAADVVGNAKEALNVAEQIDGYALLLTGESSGVPIPELKEKFETISSGVDDAFDEALREVGEIKPPQLRTDEPQSTHSSNIKDSQLKPAIKLSYKDYLRIFLLFVNSDTLGTRTADLISLNVSTKKDGYSVDSGNLFPMEKAHTDFTVETTVDLRMIFLSMPFAQKGVNGVVPPRTLPVTVKDYRGY